MRITLSWICASAVAVATRVSAQQVQGSVTIAGGSATDVVGTTSRALSVSPALSFTPDPRLIFGLGASGTRYGDQRWSLGGQASAAGRLPMGPHAALTLNADGGATGTSYDFSYTTAGVLPAIEATAGAVTVYAGVSAAVASTRLARAIPSAPGLLGETPLGSASAVTTSRASRGAIVGGNIQLSNERGDQLVLGVRDQRATIDTVLTVDRSASVAASSGRVTIAGSAGVRDERGVSATFGSGTLRLAIHPRFAIEVAGGAYPADRLIGTPGGRFLTLGLSLSTGRSSSRLPSTSGVPAPAAGLTRVTIRETDARRVEIAGDFSNWKPMAATRAPNGVWFADLRIPPGQYRYAFRIDGASWAVPDGAATVDDGFGGKSAWLIVSGTPNRPAR